MFLTPVNATEVFLLFSFTLISIAVVRAWLDIKIDICNMNLRFSCFHTTIAVEPHRESVFVVLRVSSVVSKLWQWQAFDVDSTDIARQWHLCDLTQVISKHHSGNIGEVGVVLIGCATVTEAELTLGAVHASSSTMKRAAVEAHRVVCCEVNVQGVVDISRRVEASVVEHSLEVDTVHQAIVIVVVNVGVKVSMLRHPLVHPFVVSINSDQSVLSHVSCGVLNIRIWAVWVDAHLLGRSRRWR